MNIVITSAGRRVSLVRAFQKELLALFADGKVYATDAKPELSAACQVADDYFKVPLVSDDNYRSKLIEECKARDIKIIIPTIDTELKFLADNRDRFENEGIHPVVSSTDFVKKCRDKRLTHQLFNALGVYTAKEYTKENYQLPMFLKPWDGSRSVDTFLITKEEQLTDYHKNHKRLLFLEYLDHTLFDEYTCDLYYDRQHHLRCAVPRKRIFVRDGEVNKGVTVKNELVDYIKAQLSKIDGAVGCLTVQFFVHKEKTRIYGIEINPRFGGGFPLSYLAGANFPRWILQEYLLNETLEDQFDAWENNLLMLRYDDEILVHDYQG